MLFGITVKFILNNLSRYRMQKIVEEPRSQTLFCPSFQKKLTFKKFLNRDLLTCTDI